MIKNKNSVLTLKIKKDTFLSIKKLNLDFLFNRKIVFNYLIINQKLFNFHKSFFMGFKNLNLFSIFRGLLELNFKFNNSLNFLQRNVLVSSSDLNSLLIFNEFFKNKGLILLELVYQNKIYNLSDFVYCMKRIELNVNFFFSCINYVYTKIFLIVRYFYFKCLLVTN